MLGCRGSSEEERSREGRKGAGERNGDQGGIMNVLRTPDQRFADLPGYAFAPHYVDVDGLRMHFVEEGPADAPPVLLLHGEPSWSYLYRKMIPPLAQAGRRVMAPDLIGFGRSDKPATTGDYTYERHLRWLRVFLDALELRDITVALHDWGGMLGLILAAQQPDRFSRLIVLNTSLSTGDENLPAAYYAAFDAWKQFALTAENLPVGAIVRRQCATGATMPQKVIDSYDAPFPDDSYKAGVRINDSLYPLKEGDPGLEENRRAKRALGDWAKPVLIAFSATDLTHLGQHEIFSGLFPSESVWRDVTIEGALHFLQEDKGEELAALINEFIAST